MGLDIVVYETVQLCPLVHEYQEACWGAGHIHVYEQGFPQSSRGLILGRCYLSMGDDYSFRAGSYSGYGEFRRQLCLAANQVEPEQMWANPDLFKDQPFFELINFYDNEGSIGPEACADLAMDFVDHRDTVLPVLDEIGWFGTSYKEWEKAFTTTAGSGLVYFC
jgi:hypothetical protein